MYRYGDYKIREAEYAEDAAGRARDEAIEAEAERAAQRTRTGESNEPPAAESSEES